MLNSFSSQKNYFKNKSVALVGPSPHLEGKSLGKLIDKYDIVVRINELGISKKNFKDYGKRSNVVFLTLNSGSISIYKEMIDKYDLSSIDMLVHPRHLQNRNPFIENQINDDVLELFKKLELDLDFYQVEFPSFIEVCKIFDCFPSTGSLAIYHLCHLEIKELFVCGFSFYTTKYNYNKSKSKIWLNHGPTDQNIMRLSGHDTYKEVICLKKLLGNTKINKIDGDSLFRKIILSKSDIYFLSKRFYIKYMNLDYMKNSIKLLLRWLGVSKFIKK